MFCTLGYGSAWAFDGCAGELPVAAGNDAVTAEVGPAGHDGAASHPVTTRAVCDHCCHAVSHLLMISTPGSYLSSSLAVTVQAEFSPAIISTVVSPDLKPPRV
ncbi:MAG TPA: hypothetical protein ENJ64_07405 [Thiotrichales bacterium]|nr:hypothetical protein [Thiotrichales bacterium]